MNKMSAISEKKKEYRLFAKIIRDPKPGKLINVTPEENTKNLTFQRNPLKTRKKTKKITSKSVKRSRHNKLDEEMKAALNHFNTRDQKGRLLSVMTREVGDILGTLVHRYILQVEAQVWQKKLLRNQKERKNKRVAKRMILNSKR